MVVKRIGLLLRRRNARMLNPTKPRPDEDTSLRYAAMDPIKFKVVRMAKLKVKIAQAQKAGQPVPVYTPELEAIGVMIDMLQSMYRFSVDSLGTVISPITIAVLFFFRKEYEISNLYGIRDMDLLYYMLVRCRFKPEVSSDSPAAVAARIFECLFSTLCAVFNHHDPGALDRRHFLAQHARAHLELEALRIHRVLYRALPQPDATLGGLGHCNQ